MAAVRAAREFEPDAVALDMMLPDMDGLEVLRRMREHNDRIPVLFLTSLESAADEARGLSLGAEDFIHKPFSPSVGLARIRNHLELARGRRRLRARRLDVGGVGQGPARRGARRRRGAARDVRRSRFACGGAWPGSRERDDSHAPAYWAWG